MPGWGLTRFVAMQVTIPYIAWAPEYGVERAEFLHPAYMLHKLCMQVSSSFFIFRFRVDFRDNR